MEAIGNVAEWKMIPLKILIIWKKMLLEIRYKVFDNIRDGFNNLNILCIQSRVEKAQQNLFGAQYHHHSEVGGCHNTRPPDIRPPTTEDRPI